MPNLSQIATLPPAGALTGDEKVGILDTDGLPAQTTVDALRSDTTAENLASSLADAFVTFTATAGDETSDDIAVVFQAKDIQGNDLAVATNFWLELVSDADASFALSVGAGGYIIFDNTSTGRTLCVTDETGFAEIIVTDEAVETIKIAFGGGPGCGHVAGSTIDLTFA